MAIVFFYGKCFNLFLTNKSYFLIIFLVCWVPSDKMYRNK